MMDAPTLTAAPTSGQPFTRAAAWATPRQVLYSINARMGGSGLDIDALETVKGLAAEGILGRALCYGNRQALVRPELVRSLRSHPVRLLGFLAGRRLGKSKNYYGAKRQYLDWVAARELARGSYDWFHGWSGESVRSLRMARAKDIPSVLEIPTWHHDKGKIKPAMTKQDVARAERSRLRHPLEALLISRQTVLEEYRLADLLLVLSQKAAETFHTAGVPAEKLFRLPRGVDCEQFTPCEATESHEAPGIFRAVFAGALIKRKGVHHLLEAWQRAALPHAELLLVGTVHQEMKPYLAEFATANVRTIGFVQDVAECLRTASIHVFPSTCEGSAKVTYEAAACGLPQIATREAGDVVIDGVNGLIVPPGDVVALAAALRQMHAEPARRAEMGRAGRARVEENFTWDHFRTRLRAAYAKAAELHERRKNGAA